MDTPEPTFCNELALLPAIHSDLPALAKIEAASFAEPWSDQTMRKAMMLKGNRCEVAWLDGAVVAFFFYAVIAPEVQILNLAVAPGHRRRGIATQMMRRLAGRAACRHGRPSSQNANLLDRERLTCHVSEKNLEAHLFFRRCGFKATAVFRGYYEEEAAYRFELGPGAVPWQGAFRVDQVVEVRP